MDWKFECKKWMVALSAALLLLAVAVAPTQAITIDSSSPWSALFGDEGVTSKNNKYDELSLLFNCGVGEILNDDHMLALSYDELGDFYREQQRFCDAEDFFKAADLLKQTDDDISVALEFQRLQALYQEQGMSDPANAMDKLAFKVMRNATHLKGTDVAVFLYNRAWLRFKAGQLDLAEHDFKTCLHVIHVTIGGDNVLSAVTAQRLSEVYEACNKVDEARYWLHQALKTLKAAGADDETVGIVMKNYDKLLLGGKKHHLI